MVEICETPEFHESHGDGQWPLAQVPCWIWGCCALWYFSVVVLHCWVCHKDTVLEATMSWSCHWLGCIIVQMIGVGFDADAESGGAVGLWAGEGGKKSN